MASKHRQVKPRTYAYRAITRNAKAASVPRLVIRRSLRMRRIGAMVVPRSRNAA